MEPWEQTLLRDLGQRVRERRGRLGLTLRELAGQSGLSERFLVGLEGGHANVSVLRLAALAQALGTDAAGLLAGEGDRRGQAAPLLDRSLALIGLRGAGKSSIGSQVATRLGVPFIELDARIAERAGMSAGEIFELHGAQHYRKLERQELERVLAEPASVIATAGSLVTDHQSFERLLAGATVVHLRASAEDHFARVVAQGDTRPMANRKDAMQELRAILRARRALYERAHHVVDTSALGLPRSIDRVVKLARAGSASVSP